MYSVEQIMWVSAKGLFGHFSIKLYFLGVHLSVHGINLCVIIDKFTKSFANW